MVWSSINRYILSSTCVNWMAPKLFGLDQSLGKAKGDQDSSWKYFWTSNNKHRKLGTFPKDGSSSVSWRTVDGYLRFLSTCVWSTCKNSANTKHLYVDTRPLIERKRADLFAMTQLSGHFTEASYSRRNVKWRRDATLQNVTLCNTTFGCNTISLTPQRFRPYVQFLLIWFNENLAQTFVTWHERDIRV